MISMSLQEFRRVSFILLEIGGVAQVPKIGLFGSLAAKPNVAPPSPPAVFRLCCVHAKGSVTKYGGHVLIIGVFPCRSKLDRTPQSKPKSWDFSHLVLVLKTLEIGTSLSLPHPSPSLIRFSSNPPPKKN